MTKEILSQAPLSVALVRAAYDHIFAGDLEAFLNCVHANCVLVEAKSLPYGGRHVGRQSIKAAILRVLDTWSEFRFDIEEILAGENSVIAYGMMVVRGRATDIEATFPLAERWVFKDGYVMEIVAIYGDTALAIHAAGSRAD
jgi:ketosteroid isomerase-like protein